ncbi:MAG: HAMP domain-containing protein [Gammaproteobacteria bacterium]|nr:HAMP domain-containing protein [Gammaproteobacteria bacterium]
MATAKLKKFQGGPLPIITLLVLLLASLGIMGDAMHSSTQFGQLYTALLIINIVAIVILIGLIVRNLYELQRQWRQQVTGSRLTARLIVLLAALSVTPVSVVYYFSLDFLKRGIDSWFDVQVERALKDALELSQSSLSVRMRELLKQTKAQSYELSMANNEMAALLLHDLRIRLDASELTLFGQNGQILAVSTDEASRLLPTRLEESVYTRLRQEQEYTELAPIADSGFFIRIVILIPSSDPVGESRILHGMFPVTKRINTLAKSVEEAYSRYRELGYLRIPLKTTFILTLSLILLLALLISIWMAFYFARRLVQPIADLVDGTRAVADGNYTTQLPLPGKDELGILVRSFNDMTQKIALVTDEAKRGQLQLAEQHAYLDVVLTHLSSGVITLHQDRRLYTGNAAASQILGLSLQPYVGHSLDKLIHEHPQSLLFVDTIYAHLDNHEAEWREELTLFNPGGRQVLLCRGSVLPGTGEKLGGFVIVFDDITNLIQAQRNAAWGEVARRLAHEIKNPLTPIQLSAERLRHKYLNKMDAVDREVLDRATHTIVQQVETLKEMIKAFSDYARMPHLQLQPLNINTLIREVLELYRHDPQHCQIQLHLDPSTPLIEADDGRLRQLIHNLVKNALEAMVAQPQAQLSISTLCLEKEACRFIELRVRDNGPGIPDDLVGQIFEPYITTKPKGTGLGLAIVKKIVEEHGGMIWAENTEGGGACMIIRLPVNKQHAGSSHEPLSTGKSNAAA